MDFVEQHEADTPFFTRMDPEDVASLSIGEPLVERLSSSKNNICRPLRQFGPRKNNLVTSNGTSTAGCLTAYETLHVTFDILPIPEQLVSTDWA